RIADLLYVGVERILAFEFPGFFAEAEDRVLVLGLDVVIHPKRRGEVVILDEFQRQGLAVGIERGLAAPVGGLETIEDDPTNAGAARSRRHREMVTLAAERFADQWLRRRRRFLLLLLGFLDLFLRLFLGRLVVVLLVLVLFALLLGDLVVFL